MNDNIKTLLTKFRTWKEAKVKERSTPLSAECAYTLSAINKKGTLNDVYSLYKEKVFYSIKDAARYNNTELYIYYPNYLIAGHKEQLMKELKELGYLVPYSSDKSIIISWEAK